MARNQQQNENNKRPQWRMAFPYPNNLCNQFTSHKGQRLAESIIYWNVGLVCDSFSCSFTVKVVEVWATYFRVESLALFLSLGSLGCARQQILSTITKLCRMSSEIERSLCSNVYMCVLNRIIWQRLRITRARIEAIECFFPARTHFRIELSDLVAQTAHYTQHTCT